MSKVSLGCRGCPSPWRLGTQTWGWLRSPELALSELSPNPPTLPTCAPRGWPPGQPSHSTGQDASGCQSPGGGATSPKRCGQSPCMVWGSPGSHPRAPGANCSPRRLKSSGRTTLARGEPGCPSDDGAVGWCLSRDRGTAEGRGQVAWAWVLPQVRPPRWTPAPCGHCSSGLSMLSKAGSGKCPRSSSPVVGSAPRPWQCPLPAALGVQRRAPPDSSR